MEPPGLPPGTPPASFSASQSAGIANQGAPPAAEPPAPLLPAHLCGAPPAFARQADVRFHCADGSELPAHSQLLARTCGLFAEVLEGVSEPEGGGGAAAGGVAGRPSAAAPLQVPASGYPRAEVEALLQAAYQPHTVYQLAASMQKRGAHAYGRMLDLAAYCG